ncbi:hypothetical protein NHX12_018137 [Muraenolepis orangiensis]|uniref:Transmembrane protein 109 n=1 Tax=Muraenolepis orangiensis TaxID=630683 RepID=A0A9Q0EWA9_9TELE|nr:hypothetical protein NHX12_018137 [Muraenolepis orangiensis]
MWTGLLAYFFSGALVASAVADGGEEPSPGSLAHLAAQVSSYLRELAREEAVVSARQTVSRVLVVAGEGLAAGVNLCSGYLTELLAVLGVDVGVPISQVSAEGVVFVGQWLLLSLIGYWVASLLVRSLACSLRLGFWLVKVGGALAAFVLILSDRAAAVETTAIRLAVLVLLCVLLGVGPSRGGARDDKTAQLETHVKNLEKKVKEIEKIVQ